jgi:DNA gyrase subunit A
LIGVADESDEKNRLRLVLEMKPGSNADAMMAYLFRHTALEQNFAINTTCLVPDERGVLVPARVSLHELLRHFLDFRFRTVTRRFEYQLRQLERRIHILEGFAIVFKGLDQALKIIRSSQGKQDAAARLMKAFPLDAEQTDAILDLALYRISSLEIDRILEELKQKRAEAEEIRKILASKTKLWKIVQQELEETGEKFADDRRTALGSEEEVAEFDPQAYILRENTNVVLTCDGWLKRVGRIQKVETTRVREGDCVLAVVPGSTLENVVIFSSDGVAYTLPIDQVPASSGYGDPLSKLVRVGDGARVLWATGTDGRFTPADSVVRKNQPPAPYLFIATRSGQVMRLSFSTFRTPSTKAGRRFCRLREGDAVVYVELVRDAETVFLATREARVIHFAIDDVPILGGPGKGVRGIKLAPPDEVLGAVQLARPSDCLHVTNSHDKQLSFGQMKYNVTSRGGKGIKTSTRTGFKRIEPQPIALVDWDQLEESKVQNPRSKGKED